MLETELKLANKYNKELLNNFFRSINITAGSVEWMKFRRDADSPEDINIIYSNELIELLKKDDVYVREFKNESLKHELLEAYLNDHELANKWLREGSNLPESDESFVIQKVEWQEIREHIVSARNRLNLSAEDAAAYVFSRIKYQPKDL